MIIHAKNAVFPIFAVKIAILAPKIAFDHRERHAIGLGKKYYIGFYVFDST